MRCAATSGWRSRPRRRPMGCGTTAWVSATVTAASRARPSPTYTRMCWWARTIRARRRYGCGSAPGPGIHPDQADTPGAQRLLAVEHRVLAGEEAPGEPGLGDEPGAGRARERRGVEVGAGQAGPVPGRGGDQGRLGVDRRGQVRPDAAFERVPGIPVEVRGVFGRLMVVPGEAEHLARPGGHRPYLPPPVRTAPGQGLGPAEQFAGKLGGRDLAVEADGRLGGGPVPVPAQEGPVEHQAPARAEAVAVRDVPHDR